MDGENNLADLLRQGGHILTLEGMDRQRAEEEAEVDRLHAQDRTFALVKRTFDLNMEEWEALEPEFCASDDSWYDRVILHAFGSAMLIELVATGAEEKMRLLISWQRRPYHSESLFTKDRAGLAQWLVKAQEEQLRDALIQEAQARVFTPFAFYRVWYGHEHDGDYYLDVRNHRGIDAAYCAYETVQTPSQFVWIPQPILIERITVETPKQLPGWCPTERVEIMGEEVLLFKTPEWAMPIYARKTVEELLH